MATAKGAHRHTVGGSSRPARCRSLERPLTNSCPKLFAQHTLHSDAIIAKDPPRDSEVVRPALLDDRVFKFTCWPGVGFFPLMMTCMGRPQRLMLGLASRPPTIFWQSGKKELKRQYCTTHLLILVRLLWGDPQINRSPEVCQSTPVTPPAGQCGHCGPQVEGGTCYMLIALPRPLRPPYRQRRAW
jgi:hypothetical protein